MGVHDMNDGFTGTVGIVGVGPLSVKKVFQLAEKNTPPKTRLIGHAFVLPGEGCEPDG